MVGAPVGIAAAATGFGAAPDATAPSTSPLVTRPSLPEPATDPAARLLSAISLAAAGMATPAIEPRMQGRLQRQMLLWAQRLPLAPQQALLHRPCLRCRFWQSAVRPQRYRSVGHHDFSQNAGGRCRHFQHHLVGFDLDQDFIHGNSVANLLSSIAAGWLRPRIQTAAAL